LNNKGQAYSTFKLLIAAIVALAILMILMSIISSIFPFFRNDPTEKTSELLNNLYKSPETIKTVEDVTFTPDYVLSALALSERLPLGREDICMSLGDYGDEENFELQTVGHHRIVWNGSSNKLTDIVVTCNINEEMLMDGIEGTIFTERDWDRDIDCSICEGRCCLVALKTPG